MQNPLILLRTLKQIQFFFRSNAPVYSGLENPLAYLSIQVIINESPVFFLSMINPPVHESVATIANSYVKTLLLSQVYIISSTNHSVL